MEWLDRLKEAMAYIEENLDGEIDWAIVGKRALCGGAQFARTFALMTGIPLSEYVRNRRMTRAAFDLHERGDRVLDVALRYGYASPTAFQRAFVTFHGITPREARKPGTALRAYPPMSFHITIQGGIALQYRMEDKPAFRIAGFGEDINMVGGNNFVRIPQMWEEMTPQRWEALAGAANGRYPGSFGAIHMIADKPDYLRYYIATSTDLSVAPAGMDVLNIPPLTYAIFETSMADIQDTTRRVFAEWLPTSGYEHAEAPEFEYYPDGDMSDSTKYMCEIWVPVVKK